MGSKVALRNLETDSETVICRASAKRMAIIKVQKTNKNNPYT